MARAESDGAVENPLAAEDAGSGGLAAGGGGSSAVDIEAGLKDGSLTAEQAVALVEKRTESKTARTIMRAAAQLSAASGGGALTETTPPRARRRTRREQ